MEKVIEEVIQCFLCCVRLASSASFSGTGRTFKTCGGRRSEGSCSSKPAAALLNFLTMRASSGSRFEVPCASAVAGSYTSFNTHVLVMAIPSVPTISGPMTSFCTTLSTLSNSGHISGHVPTGVIASASVRGRSGSARKPSLIAFARSVSRLFLSYVAATQKSL